MYAKVTSSGGRRCLQLVEGYRTGDGKVRQRTIGTVGRIEYLPGTALDGIRPVLQRLTPVSASSFRVQARRCG